MPFRPNYGGTRSDKRRAREDRSSAKRVERLARREAKKERAGQGAPIDWNASTTGATNAPDYKQERRCASCNDRFIASPIGPDTCEKCRQAPPHMAEVIPLQRPEPDMLDQAVSAFRKLIVEVGPAYLIRCMLMAADALPAEMQRHLASTVLNNEPRVTTGEDEQYVKDFFRLGEFTAEVNLYCMAQALPEADRHRVLIEMLRRYCIQPAPSAVA